jgi:hypothetical protein
MSFRQCKKLVDDKEVYLQFARGLKQFKPLCADQFK